MIAVYQSCLTIVPTFTTADEPLIFRSLMTDTRCAAGLADRYRLTSELGAGGMATVYLADDIKHARQVAVTVPGPERSAALGAGRFLPEITTTANVRHPQILSRYDSSEHHGMLFYVMTFVEGESLRALLDRESQLGVDDALRLADERADALQYAHGRGVVHRDIRPEHRPSRMGVPSWQTLALRPP